MMHPSHSDDQGLLPSGLARLTVSVAYGSPIEVAHAFRRVKFHL